MPQGSTRVNRPLTNLSNQYRNEDYIAGKFLKDIFVQKESDLYWVYNSQFRLEETFRANGSPANMATIGFSTSSYVCREHALKELITDTDRSNTDAPIILDRDITEFLTDQILLRQESDAATLCFTTTNWGNNTTLTTATSWNYNTTTSAPIHNVLSATGIIIAASAKAPNTLVIGWASFLSLRENNNVFQRIQYVERAIVTPEILASLFDLQAVYVGKSIVDTAKEGDTASQGMIWGADAWLAYIDPSPGIKKATAALNFRVAEKGNPYRVKKWRDEELEGDFIEAQTKYSMRAVGTSCAYLFKSVATV